jgi:hypothetical protein
MASTIGTRAALLPQASFQASLRLSTGRLAAMNGGPDVRRRVLDENRGVWRDRPQPNGANAGQPIGAGIRGVREPLWGCTPQRPFHEPRAGFEEPCEPDESAPL